MSEWNRKEEWTIKAAKCLVKVSRHEEPLLHSMPELGESRWCVYAYVYPEHSMFDKAVNNEMRDLPLHGGQSLFKTHYNASGEITSVQIGADYNYLHDAHFTHAHTADDAASVFADAEVLLKFLS